MYDCTVRLLFVACPRPVIDTIEKIHPLPRFRHEFAEIGHDDIPAAAAAAGGADVILAGPGCPQRALEALAGARKPDADLLLLCENDVQPAMLEKADDIWKLPMPEGELAFHFSRWQKGFACRMDLRETRHFLERVLDTSPNLIWFKDRSGAHELVNANFCRTVNKTLDDVRGKKHAYIWNVEKDDPACVESERVVMQSGKMHSFEEAIDTGSGKRLLTTYKAPLLNIDGTIMGTMGIAVDVTQERLYRERLLQNRTALEALFTTMDCGVICHSLDGSRVISINRAALKLLDFPSSQALEDDGFHMVARTVMDEDKPKVREAISQLKNIGDSSSYEYRVVHTDGKILHVMGNAKLVEKDGEIICQRFLLDCTAQKMAEKKEQSERERRQRELLRALCVDYQLVCVFEDAGHDGNVLQLMDYPDRNLLRIFSGEMPLEQKFSLYIDTCVYPEDRESFRQACSLRHLKSELASRKMYYFTYRALDGEDVRYFQLKAVRVGDMNYAGVVIGLQSVDSRTRQELEQKNRLGEALKEAKKASNAKTIFLSNMSHDIRTPMNAIVGYTTLALSHIGKQGQVESYLKNILASGNHLISLINDILDMSHIESGKIRLEEKRCTLSKLLHELWNIVTPSARDKQQSLTFDTDKVRDDHVYCDRLRLNQVLLNLLSNAVKYTPREGAISMRVAQLPEAVPGTGQYEFHVSDNGIGMSAEFLTRIFEPFERAQTSTEAGIQGTGLGMTITKNIVRMMNGEIDVKSEPGVGTEFVLRVTFRLAEPEAENSEPLSEESAPRVRSGSGPRGRILLAEDNAMNQEIAMEFLTGAGYEVDVAKNGRIAVEMLRNAGPGVYDVILMDVQMPVLDGYGATELVRGMPERKLASIPIIAMTANSFEEDRQEAMARGMNGHIAKPIDFRVLFATLDKLLGSREEDA